MSNILRLGDDDYAHPVIARRFNASKSVSLIPHNADLPIYQVIADKVANLYNDEPVKTLALANTVRDAQQITQAMESLGIPTLLIHSRYRDPDRVSVAQLSDFSGVIISTQSIECGVDISAKNVITAIAPWDSLVQRFGRCNRSGEYESSHIFVVDVADDQTYPYDRSRIQQSRDILSTLTSASLSDLSKVNVQIELKRTRTPDMESFADQFFHTDTDLQGSYTDISHFVRGIKDDSINVAYRDFEVIKEDGSIQLNPDNGKVKASEIVRVPIKKFQKFFDGKPLYRYSYVASGYEEVNVDQCSIGNIIIVHCDVGGYSEKFGFTGDIKDKPKPIDIHIKQPNETQDDDYQSEQNGFVTLTQHSIDTANQGNQLSHLLPKRLRSEYERACRWHDYGKAHPEWQRKILNSKAIFAKAAKGQFKPTNGRKHLRHELASMLAARANGESILVQYLILCHHGIIRTNIDQHPKERKHNLSSIRGIEDGDEVMVPVDLGNGIKVKPTQLKLAGLTSWQGQWSQDVQSLLDQYGPFTLAYLEALVRIADWKASKKPGGFYE